MDVAGAEALSWRLAQQSHWQTAGAVRLGIQPAIDPDGHALESFCDGVRRYRPRRRTEIVDGRTVTITRLLSKRLVEDAWHDDLVVEHAPTAAAQRHRRNFQPELTGGDD